MSHLWVQVVSADLDCSHCGEAKVFLVALVCLCSSTADVFVNNGNIEFPAVIAALGMEDPHYHIKFCFKDLVMVEMHFC